MAVLLIAFSTVARLDVGRATALPTRSAGDASPRSTRVEEVAGRRDNFMVFVLMAY
jgi:hypothetical protein